MMIDFKHENACLNYMQHQQKWDIFKKALGEKNWQLSISYNKKKEQYEIKGKILHLALMMDCQKFIGSVPDRVEITPLPIYSSPFIQFHPFIQFQQQHQLSFRPEPVEAFFSIWCEAMNFCNDFHYAWFSLKMNFKVCRESFAFSSRVLDLYHRKFDNRYQRINALLPYIIRRHEQGTVFLTFNLQRGFMTPEEHCKKVRRFLEKAHKFLKLKEQDSYFWQTLPSLTVPNNYYTRITFLIDYQNIENNIKSSLEFQATHLMVLFMASDSVLRLSEKRQNINKNNEEKNIQDSIIPQKTSGLWQMHTIINNPQDKNSKYTEKRLKDYLTGLGWFNDAYIMKTGRKSKAFGVRHKMNRKSFKADDNVDFNIDIEDYKFEDSKNYDNPNIMSDGA